MTELKIFIPTTGIKKNKEKEEEQVAPINFFNKKIIQHELNTATVNTVAWTHIKKTKEKQFLFLSRERIDSLQVAKLGSDLFSVQVNEKIISSSNLKDTIKYLIDFYSSIKKKLLMENFTDDIESYLQLINRPSEEEHQALCQDKITTKNNLVDMQKEIKEKLREEPKFFNWLKERKKEAEEADKELKQIVANAPAE